MQVTVVDSTHVPSPEARSVLQALASRSLKPISEHLEKVNKDKTESFVRTHVIGYGHESVSECADGIIISCSDVSMLAEKALEDNPLFRGTAASTRYILWDKQPFIGAKDSHNTTLEIMRAFYLDNLPATEDYLRTQFPIKGEMDPVVYNKAIKAKTFDIMRGFLPAGATTMVNWATDIRTAKRRLSELYHHPLPEIRNIASSIISALKTQYPASMSDDITKFDHIDKYTMEYHYYNEDPQYAEKIMWGNPKYEYGKFDVGFIEEDLATVEANHPSLKERPRGCPTPRIYSSRFDVCGLVDYGSFRDIQRQRNGICKIPVLNTRNGFEQWYMDQLPPDVLKKATKYLNFVESNVNNDDILDQYIVPIGYRVPFLLDYSLEQMIYVSELRSSKHVHPTARNIGLHIADFLEEHAPFAKIYIDRSEPDFNLNRGKHDIEMKENAA